MTFPEENNLEIWKPIPEYENYEVSTWGRVRNSSGKIFEKRLCKKGYNRTCLYKNFKRFEFLTHRLVALTFIPNPEKLSQINHIDGKKENNNVKNLEWCDGFHNMKHSWKNGLRKHPKGEINGSSKLTDIEVSEIRKFTIEGWAQKKIAEKFDVSIRTISRIQQGKSWTHI